MAKKKQITILLTIVAILLAAYFGLNAYNGWTYEKETKKTSKELTVTDLNTKSMRKIRYTNGENTVTFEKNEDNWYYAQDRELPLKQSCATEAINVFSNITANRKLSKTDSPGDYGLSSPAYTVVLTDADGEETKVEIGNSTGGNYYLTADGAVTVFTVGSTILDSLIFDTDTMIQTETFPEIDSESLKSFTVKQNDKTLVSCSGKDEELSDYGSDLSDLLLDTCVNYKTTSEDLKQYGLDKKTRKVMTAVYKDSDTEKQQRFYMGKVFEENGSDYAYLQLEGSKMVYKVFVSDTEKLIAD